MTPIPDDILADPTRCYARCGRENQIVLHLTDSPPGMADLCWECARLAVGDTPLVLGCPCAFCERAREQILVEHHHDPGVLLCDGCRGIWWVIDDTGATLTLDLNDRGLAARVEPGEAPVVQVPEPAAGQDWPVRLARLGLVLAGEPVVIETEDGRRFTSGGAALVFTRGPGDASDA